MLTLAEARSLIAEHVHILAPERLPLAEARGRVLRETLVATEDIPAFDRSAMDGYAVNGDGTGPFPIVAELPAGAVSDRTICPGECARVFTGSAIPSGTTQVVIQELAQARGRFGFIRETRRRDKHPPARRGRARRERDDRPRRAPRCAGTLPLRTARKREPLVSPRPRILHVATGSEIVPPDAAAPGQIRDSNSTLVARAHRRGRRRSSRSIALAMTSPR